jgi:hypothetical protein
VQKEFRNCIVEMVIEEIVVVIEVEEGIVSMLTKPLLQGARTAVQFIFHRFMSHKLLKTPLSCNITIYKDTPCDMRI